MGQRASEEWGWVAWLRSRVRLGRREWRRLLDARISLVIIASGAFVLMLPQGQDVVRNLVDTANRYLRDPETRWTGPALVSYVRWTYFLLACVWSGILAWYWPSLLTRARVPGREPGWFRFVRRVLGILPLLCATATIVFTGAGSPRDVWIATGFFVPTTMAVYAFFVIRRRYIEKPHRERWWTRRSGLLAPALRRMGGRHEIGLTRGDDAFVVLSLALSVLMLVAFAVPGPRTALATHLGAAAIAFGAIGSIIAGVSGLLLILFGSRLPVLALGAIAIILFTPFNDNHRIRAVPSSLLATRPDLHSAYRRWADAHPDGPIVLVATAGGASRAAYWTATVLRALDERTQGRFGRQVFAISSVSGGTLGATGYAAWLADQHIGGAPCRYSTSDRRRFDQSFMGGDYLSPAVGGLLYTDMVQGFLPFPLFLDRTSFLEEGWRREWDAAAMVPGNCAPKRGRMAQDYLEIWRGSLWGHDPWIPLVLSNGTLAEDGKRVITAPIRVEPAVFLDGHDFLDLFGHSVAASTAISNSARFPIVSPAGTIPVKGGALHIVDGGYFENGGLETLYDLARHIRAVEDRRRPMLIIEINNDDDAPGDPYSQDNLARYPNGAGLGETARVGLDVAAPDPASVRLAPGPASILAAFYGTRTSRGILSAKRLSSLRAVGLTDAYRVTFNLGPLAARRRTAMSWSLSLSSRDYMDDALEVPAGRRSSRERGREGVVQRMMRTTLGCQRAAGDAIAVVLGAPPTRGARCPLGTKDAQWVGMPLGMTASTGSN